MRTALMVVLLMLVLGTCQRAPQPSTSASREILSTADAACTPKPSSDLLRCDCPPNQAVAEECRRNRDLLKQLRTAEERGQPARLLEDGTVAGP